MRPKALPISALALALLAAGTSSAAESLRVATNGHYLVKADGSPFFYLADTAWELCHRLNREEAGLYLSNRAAKGFTVIQAAILAELDGLKTPNAYGDVPLEGLDPAQPNEAYFKHVDFIVDQAAKLGLTMGLLPTWGDKFNRKWGLGPEVFTPDNAKAYGQFLGERYRDKPVIWILGGDRNPEKEEHLEIIRAMAEGLGTGHGGRQLMTFHPQGGSRSSRWFHRDAWLSFNTFQSGHGESHHPNYKTTLADGGLEPAKPTLDSEPRYEDHPIAWDPAQGWFDEADARQAAYWSMLAGACGHAYGNHNVWQMWQPGRTPIASARTPWKTALDQPGAAQMGHLRRLFESRPWQTLRPDTAILTNNATQGASQVLAARAADRSFALVYSPAGEPVLLRLDQLSGKQINACRFDPRTGQAEALGPFAPGPSQSFYFPSQGRGQDWVLVLDDAARKFSLPGKDDEP